MSLDGLEQLAVPIDQPGHLVAIRVQGQVVGLRVLSRDLLLPDPQAAWSVGHHGQRVGIHAWRLEHPRRLRRSGRSRAASAAAWSTPACPIWSRAALLRQRNRRRTEVECETGRQKFASFHAHGVTSRLPRFRGMSAAAGGGPYTTQVVAGNTRLDMTK